jgi:PAS domain-containing protein
LYGNTPSEALMQVWECGAGDLAPQVWRDLAADSLTSKKNKTIEIECNGKAYEMIVTPVAEKGYVNLYGSDITDRKQAQEALQASTRILEAVIDTIPARVFWKDKDLVYLGCNEIFARDAGITDSNDKYNLFQLFLGFGRVDAMYLLQFLFL